MEDRKSVQETRIIFAILFGDAIVTKMHTSTSNTVIGHFIFIFKTNYLTLQTIHSIYYERLGLVNPQIVYCITICNLMSCLPKNIEAPRHHTVCIHRRVGNS